MESITYVASDMAYYKFERVIAERIRGLKGPLFTTDVTGLFEMYLCRIDRDKQHYNCKTCRKFIETYGGLVTIDKLGQTQSVLWRDDAPMFFQDSVLIMKEAVERARVTGVHINNEEVWGRPKTGPWSHLSGRPELLGMPATALQTAHQIEAEKREDFILLSRALAEYGLSTVRQAVRVLEADALDRSEKTLGAAKWFLALSESMCKNSKSNRNLTWLAVATAPPGWCHVKTNVISTLLDDIVAGMRYEEIAIRWAKKMHPLQYQRPTAPPSEGLIERANKIMEELKFAGALSRRFARLDEVVAYWRQVPVLGVPAQGGGFFDHLRREQGLGKNRPLELPATKMTWARFEQEVLPQAHEIELKVPGFGAYFGLVTSQDQDAPPILQWDDPNCRNPVSWFFFHGGSRAQDWNLVTDRWVNINAICRSPAHWHGGHEHHKAMSMLVLDGAHLTERKSHGGFFPECLRTEFREIRAVLESHVKQTEVAGASEGSANGFALQRGEEYDVVVRVNSSDLYKIDRWE